MHAVGGQARLGIGEKIDQKQFVEVVLDVFVRGLGVVVPFLLRVEFFQLHGRRAKEGGEPKVSKLKAVEGGAGKAPAAAPRPEPKESKPWYKVW